MSDDDAEPRTLWGQPVAFDEDCPRGKVYLIAGTLHINPADWESLEGE